MTDYQVLGLDNSFTYEELKKAFRKKSKQFHPDINKDTLNSHMAMIRLNQAYSNLLKTIDKTSGNNSVSPAKDNAYSVYKEGINRFQNIHPSKWKTFSKKGLFDSGAVKTNSDTPSVIQTLITEMAEAYHSFSTIVNEYENSPWYTDSLDKMCEIERMTKRYMKIKESYESELKLKNA